MVVMKCALAEQTGVVAIAFGETGAVSAAGDVDHRRRGGERTLSCESVA